MRSDEEGFDDENVGEALDCLKFYYSTKYYKYLDSLSRQHSFISKALSLPTSI
jgi:hypothetical protein